VIGDRPTDLIGYLQDREDLKLGQVDAINLGGHTGLQVTVEGNDKRGCTEFGPDDPFWTLFYSGEDTFSLGTDEHLRLVALDVGGRTVSFLVFVIGDGLEDYFQ